MVLDRVHPVGVVHGALAAGVGLDVVVIDAVARVDSADVEQVHGARAGRQHLFGDHGSKRAEERIGDPLCRDDVGVAHCCRVLRGQEAALSHYDLDGTVGPALGGSSGSRQALST